MIELIQGCKCSRSKWPPAGGLGSPGQDSVDATPPAIHAHLRFSGRLEWMLLVDAANVVGSRPTGWWRDRPGAARTFVERVRSTSQAGQFSEPVVVVLEGAARSGVEEGVADGVRVVHAPGSGDDLLVSLAIESEDSVTLVSADRALRERVEDAGARVVGPGWLLDRLKG